MEQNDQSSINDIISKLERVLKKLEQSGGPEVAEKLKNFISFNQTFERENPMHLPDIQKEATKVIEKTKDDPLGRNIKMM